MSPKNRPRAHPRQTARANSYAPISRGFCNAPIVRSAAATPQWKDDGETWQCDLHRGSVIVNYAGNHPRLPNAADFDLLLRLGALGLQKQFGAIFDKAWAAGKRGIDLEYASRNKRRSGNHEAIYGGPGDLPNSVWARAERQRGSKDFKRALDKARKDRAPLGDVVLTFASLRALVIALGRNPTAPGNRRSVIASLRLWWRLQATYKRWYSAKGHHTQHIEFIAGLRLPSDDNPSIRIRLSASFMQTYEGNFIVEPLPLPVALNSPAALNLYLQAKAWNADDEAPGREMKLEALADLIGLDGETWRQRQGLGKIAASLAHSLDKHDRPALPIRIVPGGTVIIGGRAMRQVSEAGTNLARALRDMRAENEEREQEDEQRLNWTRMGI